MVGGLEGIPLPAALVTALREGSGSGAHGLVGILLFVLSSVPLGQLSRKAASVLVVLLSAVLAAVKRLRERRTLSSESGHEQMVFNDAFGTRHEVRAAGTQTLCHTFKRQPHTPKQRPIIIPLTRTLVSKHWTGAILGRCRRG